MPSTSSERSKLPVAEGFGSPEGSSVVDELLISGATGGVVDHGTREEDGPGTWEAHVSPRRYPAQRGAGDQTPEDGARVDAHAADENAIHVEVGRQRARAEPRPKEQGSRRAAYEL